MIPSDVFDIVIIGSGPSGAQAAVEATASGAKVAMVDVGQTDERFAALIPEKTFPELRATDPKQQDYFLGNVDDYVERLSRGGAHLTPPRQYMVRDSEALFPLESTSFFPLISTSAGGLGIGWGTNVFTLSDDELVRIGLSPSEIRPYYDRVAADIGVSGDASDDAGALFGALSPLQGPLDIDTNARTFLSAYKRARTSLNRQGFILGQSVLAVLSEALGDRKGNPHSDMDFYSDRDKSAYRPQFTLAELKKLPNFEYFGGRVATDFEEASNGEVALRGRAIDDGETWQLRARRVILAAGALNSARIVLRSCPGRGTQVPVLCNPNVWVAAINLGMLGRQARDLRYSLAQLTALLTSSKDDTNGTIAQFYSYRSLLWSRVLPAIPMPPKLGLKFLRLVGTAFTAVNVHFPDWPSPTKTASLAPENTDVLHVDYALDRDQISANRRAEMRLLQCLVRIGCIPLAVSRPLHGASIHYGGTLPMDDNGTGLTSDPSGRLNGTTAVYVADSSTWRYLPAKGLTFTLMANARRIARNVVESLS